MRWPMVVYRGGGFDGQEAGTENRPDENKRKWRAAVSAGRGRHIGESLQVDAGGREYGEFSESLKGEFLHAHKSRRERQAGCRFPLTSGWQGRTMKAGVLCRKGC